MTSIKIKKLSKKYSAAFLLDFRFLKKLSFKINVDMHILDRALERERDRLVARNDVVFQSF